MTNETTASQPKSIRDDELGEFIDEYEWRTDDFCHKPTALERQMLLDFAVNLIDSRAPAAQASAEVVRNNVPGSPHNVCRTTEHNLRKRITELEAQASATIQAGWQAIETAPEVKGDYFFCLIAWGPEGDQNCGEGMRWKGRWFAAPVFHAIGQDRKYAMREVEVKPTHWMPSPAAPDAATIQEPVMVAEPVDIAMPTAPVSAIHEAERLFYYRGWREAMEAVKASRAAPRVADPVDDAAKAVHWFSCLDECAKLLGLPDDEPIPSGVVKAVRTLAAPMVADPAGVVPEAFKSAFLKWNGFHTEAEIAVEWAAHGGLCGTFFREGLAATVKAVPSEAVEGCEHCLHTYCLSSEICRHCGDVNGTQGYKGGKLAAPLADKTGGGE